VVAYLEVELSNLITMMVLLLKQSESKRKEQKLSFIILTILGR
jgi:hypothetical protein